MRLAPSLKYQLSSIKWPVIIYYIVIYSLALLLGITFFAFRNINLDMRFGGIDASSMIFLFVVGLNAYKSTFHMFCSNGISRKTLFVSFAAAAAILCAGVALIDTFNSLILSQLIEYQPAWTLAFEARYASSGTLMYAEGFLNMFFKNLACIMLGYFITTAFYRMNKPLKLAVSIGVPVFFFILLPIIDAQLFSGEIFRFFASVAAFCSGRLSGSPYVAMGMDLAFAAVSGLIAYLLSRRATVKLSVS